MKAGNKQAAEDIKEFLQLTKNQDDKKVATGLRGAARKDESLTTAQQDEWMLKNDLLDSTATLTTQYKEGKITAAEYKKLAKAADPKLTDNDVWWKIDRIDYQKEKGGDSGLLSPPFGVYQSNEMEFMTESMISRAAASSPYQMK